MIFQDQTTAANPYQKRINKALRDRGLPMWKCGGRAAKADGDSFYSAVMAALEDEEVRSKAHPRAKEGIRTVKQFRQVTFSSRTTGGLGVSPIGHLQTCFYVNQESLSLLVDSRLLSPDSSNSSTAENCYSCTGGAATRD